MPARAQRPAGRIAAALPTAFACGVVSLLLAAPAHAQQIYPLGWSCTSIPNNCLFPCTPVVTPVAINLSGQVLASVDGSACVGYPYFVASRYDQLAAGNPAPNLSLIASGSPTRRGGLNARGTLVISFTFQAPFDAPQTIYREASSTSSSLNIVLNSASANAINNLGDFVGSRDTSAEPPLPFGYSAYRYLGRPNLNGAPFFAQSPNPLAFAAEAFAINSRGQIAGITVPNQGPLTAFFNTPGPTTEGTPLELFTVSGVNFSTAVAINDRAQIAGILQRPDLLFRAFRIDNPGAPTQSFYDLGSLAGPLGESFAAGITHNGIVVGTTDTPSGARAPFMYFGTPGVDGFFINLDAWLDENFPAAGAQWTLTSATAVSPNGWVGGVGVFNGAPRAYLLDARFLVPNCPAPVITTQPAPRSACPGTPADFSVAASNAAFAGFRWEWSLNAGPWTPWTPTSTAVTTGGVTIATLTGGDTATLRATPDPLTFSAGNALRVRANIATECGVLTSADVPLTVLAPPLIDRAPRSIIVCPSGAAQLDARINSPEPILLSWSFTLPISGDRQIITNGPNRDENQNPLFFAEGADTDRPVLFPPNTGGGPRWPFTTLTGIVLTAQGPCGTVDSQPVTITVCPADANCSGAITVQDIFDFLTLYFAASPSADINASGSLTVQDIFDFLTAYFAGC